MPKFKAIKSIKQPEQVQPIIKQSFAKIIFYLILATLMVNISPIFFPTDSLLTPNLTYNILYGIYLAIDFSMICYISYILFGKLTYALYKYTKLIGEEIKKL